MTKDIVSIREVYQLVDQKTETVNKSIIRVEEKLDKLETGRLSTLETSLANLQGRMMMIPLFITLGVNVFFFLMDYFLFKK